MADVNAPLALIVEDEPAQVELASYNLRRDGFETVSADNGEDGLLLAEELVPDLIVLDWMLPTVSGIEVCRRLKRQKTTRKIPIIMVTARGEETDRVRGLDIGADDYLVKPYSVAELVARARALLRRTRASSVGEQLVYGDIVMDAERHKVRRNGEPVKLGPTEYRLLAALLEKPGRVWTRDQLLDRVWARDKDVDDRTVDVHIGRLRKALRQPGKKPPIRTVRGVGYSLDRDD